jgi:hypothetical protein
LRTRKRNFPIRKKQFIFAIIRAPSRPDVGGKNHGKKPYLSRYLTDLAPTTPRSLKVPATRGLREVQPESHQHFAGMLHVVAG